MYLRGESQPEHEKHFLLISEIFNCLFLKRDAVFESAHSKVKAGFAFGESKGQGLQNQLVLHPPESH